ncbi:MAG TPA: 4-hydroxybenzoate 3-monooxygenase [Solirubrobacteraceae bacterium]|nr:4-hydroxybenzoate 3-monooxygenase [Solirubrobacteraceae bacterium]
MQTRPIRTGPALTEMAAERTEVAIVGAGPAGLVLGRLLHRHGIETVILEARDRDYVEGRIRAGVLEQGTVDVLHETGVCGRLDREGLVHDGIYFNVDGDRQHIPMATLTGSAVTIYGQTEVVSDLIEARIDDGAPLRFESRATGFDDLNGDAPVVRYIDADGRERRLQARFVAGCDGFHGVCRAAVPEHALQTWTREYPFAWLGILADVAPSTDELIYAHHESGFALHSMRSPQVSRLYLQVAPDEPLERWPEDRIWEELAVRLGTTGWTLRSGPIVERSVTPMRSFVAAPMRHGSLLLAGDAAHIVPPTGAKGLNLAVADVAVLAPALVDCLRGRDPGALLRYSDRCLERVWRAQHFSWWMTTMLHVDPEMSPYDRQLQRSQLRYVMSSRAAQTSLAENYVGLPLRT